MCGPSSQEQNLEAQEASFDQTLQQEASQTYANQQQILSTLNGILQPIVQAGPSQTGFSPQELSALNSQAIDTTAQNYQQEAQALGQQEDALGGGRSFLPSGVNAQINAGLASTNENNLSNEELGITQANYAQGNANYQNALAGEESVASGENPLGYSYLTNQGNQTAFNEANDINQQSNQEFSDILGGITSVALAPFTGGASLGYGALSLPGSGSPPSNQSSGGADANNPPLGDIFSSELTPANA